jgi:hypothetical protein
MDWEIFGVKFIFGLSPGLLLHLYIVGSGFKGDDVEFRSHQEESRGSEGINSAFQSGECLGFG